MSRKRYRSKRYLEFIRAHDCVVTGRSHTVAHHVRMDGAGGMGLKPDDYRCLPLDQIEHRRLHDGGERSYWTAANINPHIMIVSHLVRYLCEHGSERETVEALCDVAADLDDKLTPGHVVDERIRGGGSD